MTWREQCCSLQVSLHGDVSPSTRLAYFAAGFRLVMISSASPGLAYGFSAFGQPTAFLVLYWNQFAPYQSGTVGNCS